MSMKNPLTPAGIEPATFRFAAQHLNHYATAVPAVHFGSHATHTHTTRGGAVSTVTLSWAGRPCIFILAAQT
jgi:hypothetical protein